MYKITEERPDSGQFCAVWEYDDGLWCQELRVTSWGEIQAFSQDEGDWTYFNLGQLNHQEVSNLRYIIKE